MALKKVRVWGRLAEDPRSATIDGREVVTFSLLREKCIKSEGCTWRKVDGRYNVVVEKNRKFRDKILNLKKDVCVLLRGEDSMGSNLFNNNSSYCLMVSSRSDDLVTTYRGQEIS